MDIKIYKRKKANELKRNLPVPNQVIDSLLLGKKVFVSRGGVVNGTSQYHKSVTYHVGAELTNPTNKDIEVRILLELPNKDSYKSNETWILQTKIRPNQQNRAWISAGVPLTKFRKFVVKSITISSSETTNSSTPEIKVSKLLGLPSRFSQILKIAIIATIIFIIFQILSTPYGWNV